MSLPAADHGRPGKRDGNAANASGCAGSRARAPAARCKAAHNESTRARNDNNCRVAEKPTIGKPVSTGSARQRRPLERGGPLAGRRTPDPTRQAELCREFACRSTRFHLFPGPRTAGSAAISGEAAGASAFGVEARGRPPRAGSTRLKRSASGICSKRRTIRPRAACHSATTAPNFVFPSACRTITTTSMPAGQVVLTVRKASRTRRLARLRSTAFPTRRDAVIPSRGPRLGADRRSMKTKPGDTTRCPACWMRR